MKIAFINLNPMQGEYIMVEQSILNRFKKIISINLAKDKDLLENWR